MAGEGAVVGRPLTEAELVERAKRGDQDAYGDLVHAYQGIAFRTAYLLTGSAADAEDAAQDAFVKAYYALGRFRKGAELRPWLLRIVANEARNRRRSAGRRTHLALRAAADPLSGGAAPSPEANLIASEQQETLLAAVNALPEEQREVVAPVLPRAVGGGDRRDAGAPEGHRQVRLSRGLDRLGEELGDD